MNNHSRTDALYSSVNLIDKSNSLNTGENYDPFVSQLKSTIKKDVKNLGFGEVSKTLRSTLMPHSYNLTPGIEEFQNDILRKMGQTLHAK